LEGKGEIQKDTKKKNKPEVEGKKGGLSENLKGMAERSLCIEGAKRKMIGEGGNHISHGWNIFSEKKKGGGGF